MNIKFFFKENNKIYIENLLLEKNLLNNLTNQQISNLKFIKIINECLTIYKFKLKDIILIIQKFYQTNSNSIIHINEILPYLLEKSNFLLY